MQQPIRRQLLPNQGGQSVVYLGQLRPNGPIVILKYCRYFDNPVARADFINQIKVLSWPRPGVIPILAADTSAQQPWYAMPYYPGGSLANYAGNLAPHQLFAVAAHLANNLNTFHLSAGAFGDLKPHNVLISPQGIPTLADPLGNGHFGLIGAFFPQKRGAGTPGYMAPEVQAGGPISIEADWYSFAASLYHLVTGQVPQPGQQLNPVAPGHPCPTVIRDIILACSQPDPRFRPRFNEVRQMLNGGTFKDILHARQQAQQQRQEQLNGLITAGVIVGLGALAFAALAGSKA